MMLMHQTSDSHRRRVVQRVAAGGLLDAGQLGLGHHAQVHFVQAGIVAANDGPIFLALLSGGTPEELAPYGEMGFAVVFDNTALSGRRYMLLLREGTAP